MNENPTCSTDCKAGALDVGFFLSAAEDELACSEDVNLLRNLCLPPTHAGEGGNFCNGVDLNLGCAYEGV